MKVFFLRYLDSIFSLKILFFIKTIILFYFNFLGKDISTMFSCGGGGSASGSGA